MRAPRISRVPKYASKSFRTPRIRQGPSRCLRGKSGEAPSLPARPQPFAPSELARRALAVFGAKARQFSRVTKYASKSFRTPRIRQGPSRCLRGESGKAPLFPRVLNLVPWSERLSRIVFPLAWCYFVLYCDTGRSVITLYELKGVEGDERYCLRELPGSSLRTSGQDGA